jgi:interferon gamma-inducible protein 30
MLPYGNAQGTGSNIQCQHGPEECKANMVEACGIKHLTDSKDYMPYLFCAEGSLINGGTPAEVISKCVKDPTTAAAITKCYGEGKGKEGISLENAAEAATQPFNHQYTPWVVVDGKHSVAAENNLEKAICHAYKGENPPAACSKHHRSCPREPAPDTITV